MTDAISGDPSLQNIYTHLSARIAKSVMYIVNDRDDTDDIMQEAWIKYLNVKNENTKIDNPLAFLRRIAVNLALDALRHRRRKQMIFSNMESKTHPDGTHTDGMENIPTPGTSVEDSLFYSLTFERIMDQLRKLPPKCRKAFMLNAIEGRTHVEVSEQMGLSVSTIEKYCRRALLSVRSTVPNIFAYA
jgi:RNA polymerase sigma factor (sigma-70 family)